MAYKDPRDPRLRESRLRWYQKNKAKQLARQRDRKRELVAWIRSLKVSCSRCEFDEPAALTFHHRDPAEKSSSIAMAASNGWSRDRLETEMAKCDVLCANCHAIEHWGSGAGNTEEIPNLLSAGFDS